MIFSDWIKTAFPNKGNNSHTVYSMEDMHKAFYAGTMHGTESKEDKMTEEEITEEIEEIKEDLTENKKTHKAKHTSLIAQIIAALWVAVWCGKKFFTDGGETTDIIFSGFAIAACFSPIYFNMILDKIKNIKFGD